MLTLKSPQVVQETALRWKREYKIAFVATMGCLHDGHLALIEKAREYGQKVIVSVFVNPLQFGPNEDFAKYPRTLEEDIAKLETAKVDLLFAPEVEDLYPAGFATAIHVGRIAEPLCGKFRPGHFDGVATVCQKLFQITQADYTVFGEKDFQQLRVIQRMTEDLNLPITVLPHPTVREKDGLALSSRNRYLSEDERARAAAIPRATQAALAYFQRHAFATVGELIAVARDPIVEAGFEVQYLEVMASRDLEPLASNQQVAAVVAPRLLLAVLSGKRRLIDNIALNGDVR